MQINRVLVLVPTKRLRNLGSCFFLTEPRTHLLERQELDMSKIDKIFTSIVITTYMSAAPGSNSE